MNFRFKVLVSLIPAYMLLVTTAFAVVPPVPPSPSHYVMDLAGIIDNNVERRLDGYLKELEQKTTAQVVVLTVLSLEGDSIERVSLTIAHDRWKLGQKGKDNGALLLVAFKDRQYRFEIGYGLEGILPDSLVGTIGRKYLVPYFRRGDYSKGIFAATMAVINEIASSEGVEIKGLTKSRQAVRPVRSRRVGGIFSLLFTILFVIAAMILFVRHPRLFLFLLLMSTMGGRRGGWSGGGGFGGGGGSFGGGGGGGFGGGGVSGRW